MSINCPPGEKGILIIRNFSQSNQASVSDAFREWSIVHKGSYCSSHQFVRVSSTASFEIWRCAWPDMINSWISQIYILWVFIPSVNVKQSTSLRLRICLKTMEESSFLSVWSWSENQSTHHQRNEHQRKIICRLLGRIWPRRPPRCCQRRLLHQWHCFEPKPRFGHALRILWWFVCRFFLYIVQIPEHFHLHLADKHTPGASNLLMSYDFSQLLLQGRPHSVHSDQRARAECSRW